MKNKMSKNMQKRRERHNHLRDLKRRFHANMGMFPTVTALKKALKQNRTRFETIVLRKMLRAAQARLDKLKV